MPNLFQLFAISAVTMGLSQTVARERLCDPVRRFCHERSEWLGYLVSCPYCVSHWIAFALVPLTGTRVIEVPFGPGPLPSILSWLLSSIFVAVIAAFLRVVFYFVDETQGLVRRQQKRLDVAVERAERADVAIHRAPARRARRRALLRRRSFASRTRPARAPG